MQWRLTIENRFIRLILRLENAKIKLVQLIFELNKTKCWKYFKKIVFLIMYLITLQDYSIDMYRPQYVYNIL